MEDLRRPDFRIKTIADITDDRHGSIPCNLGDDDWKPVYGVDRNSLKWREPYLPGSVDLMAVGNLPNELPRDASRYFGEQMIKFVLDDIRKGGSGIINRATMVKEGKLNEPFLYMKEYAESKLFHPLLKIASPAKPDRIDVGYRHHERSEVIFWIVDCFIRQRWQWRSFINTGNTPAADR